MNYLINFFLFLRRQLKQLPSASAQDLTEYALLVALIAVVVVLAIVFFGNSISGFISGIGATVASWLS